VTRRPLKNIGTSVRARLLHLAHERGDDFQLLLTRYANERLLFRLVSSAHASRFVLKGAALFTIWTVKQHRATRDIDLLGFGNPGVAGVREAFAEILALELADDGVRFDLASLVVGPIRDDQEYGGVRAEVIARVANAEVKLQVDVGFGDAITPEAALVEFPALLDFPAPRLRAYPRETVVAEKLDAMVQLGHANSRMKDFYDVALLARAFAFDGALLAQAIKATFDRRKTPIPSALPVALTAPFADDPTKKTQWSGFVRKAGIQDAGSLADTVAAVATFAEVPLMAAARGVVPVTRWRAGGPWA
jgi:predicted nucleotidyltransferase component of viral defense system